MPWFSQVLGTIPNLQFAIFPPATWSPWFVRAVSGLLLISSGFLSLGCVPTGFLFGVFPFFFFSCCDYERELWSLGFFPYSFKHIFVIPIIKKSLLDHQILPKHEPISSLVFLAMLLEKGAQPVLSADTNNYSCSPPPVVLCSSQHPNSIQRPTENLLLCSNQIGFHQP